MKAFLFKSVQLAAVLIFSAQLLTAQSDEDYKMKISKINDEMAKAMVAGETATLIGHYTKDVISMPNNGKMIEGIEALKLSNEEMMKSGIKVTSFKTTTLKVSSCNNLITEIGSYEISFEGEQLPAPMNDVGKYLTIWEKQADGSLLIKVETWNTDQNPMGM